MTGGTCPLIVQTTWWNLKTIQPGTSGHISVTMTLSKSITTPHKVYVQGKWDGDVVISKAKWEIGNRATDWSPNPDDTKKQIEENKFLLKAFQTSKDALGNDKYTTDVCGGVVLSNFLGVKDLKTNIAVAGIVSPVSADEFPERAENNIAFFAGAQTEGAWNTAPFSVTYDGEVRMTKAEISSASASGGELLLGDGKISVSNGSKVSRFTCDNHGTIASAFPKSVTTNGTFTALDYTKECITIITALGESECVIEDTLISATRTITGFPSGALTIPKRDFTVSLAMSASEAWVKFAAWKCSVTVSYKLTLNGTAIQTTTAVVTTMKGDGSLTPPLVTGSVKHEVPKISKEIGGGTLVETFSVVLSGTVTAQNKVPTKLDAVVAAVTISRTAATASACSSRTACPSC